MKPEIQIHHLFEEMFNSKILDKSNLWDNLSDYKFSQEELEYIQRIKNQKYAEFSGIQNTTLQDVFRSFFHKFGFFDFQFDNFAEGWRYPTVEVYFNDKLDLGYIYTDDHEIIPFKGFQNGVYVYEKFIRGTTNT
ncbi:MAG: hypothetical protein ACK5G0_01770 [Bacteroidota bacterium]|jgi:hypothetical protein